MKIKDQAEFTKLYPLIFTDVVKKAAIEGPVEQHGDKGFEMSNGMIWL